MDTEARPGSSLIELTSDIVSAYVAHNTVPVVDLPRLIERVHATLAEIQGAPAAEPRVELKPAVSVKKSVTDDHIVCLEDGKKFKSLKRHLRTRYDMSPEEYREKWGLAADYPMVAPLRADPRFAALIRQIEADNARMRQIVVQRDTPRAKTAAEAGIEKKPA
jgi:predicted transcriptional regulator